MIKLKEAREKRASLVKQMNDINDKATEEKRALSQEENTEWDRIDSEVETVTEEIRKLQRLVDLNKEAAKSADPLQTEGDQKRQTPQEIEKRNQEVFTKWAINGGSSLSEEERSVLKSLAVVEKRQSTTASAGGYTIPTGFSNMIEIAMKSYGGMLEVANIIKTISGNPLPWPTVNDTTNKGRLLSEGGDAASGATAITFTNKQLVAYKFTSDFLPVTQELLDDSAFDIPALLNDLFTERLARIVNQYLTLGTGSSQPEGAVVASSAGKTASANTTIGADEVIDLLHSVNSAYRTNGRFMFNDNTLKVVKKLKDSTNQYLWQTSYRDGDPETILGKPYTINDDMADIGASTKSMLFGDFSKFRVRQVGNPYLKRSEHIYVETDEIGMGLFGRYDSKLIDGGGGAIKHLVHPA